MRALQPCKLFALALVLLLVVAPLSTAQSFSVLYNFGSNSNDPYLPESSGIVAQGRDGNLYTGAQGGALGFGAVFQITPARVLKVLYSFADSDDGGHPVGGLTLGTDGNFYGTTDEGGTPNYGTVFKITPGGSLTTLHTFTGGNDGGAPSAPPVEGTDGNFYGTTYGGGPAFLGSVYKITAAGKFTPLYDFDGPHGGAPAAPLTQGTDGNFYGTASQGGTSGRGVVFKITSAGKLTVLYNFDGAHGATPFGPLIQGSDGNFYGTTSQGGNGAGVVFRMTPSGKLTVLHAMSGSDGGGAYAGLVQANDGSFYGANASGGQPSSGCPSGCGTVFKVTTKGKLTVLHNFDLTTGSTPYDTPFQHTNGTLYADTNLGGTGSVGFCTPGNCGVFYDWTDSAHLPPFVTLLPYSGKVGKTIEFLGQGFRGTTGVSFNGTAASFKIVSDNYLTASVPNGATTGPVTVTESSGNLTSNKIFRVTPQLLSFNPTSGPVGTPVTIVGVSLALTTKVTFGGIQASQFIVNSDTQVTATVPAGAKTGHIVITTPGGTAVSQGIFTVTQ